MSLRAKNQGKLQKGSYTGKRKTSDKPKKYPPSKKSKREDVYVAPIVKQVSGGNGRVIDYQSKVQYATNWSTAFLDGDFVAGSRSANPVNLLGDSKGHCMTLVSSGSGPDQRQGNRITLKSLNLIVSACQCVDEIGRNVNIYGFGPLGKPANAWRGRPVRIVVVIDQFSNGGVPVVEDIFQSGVSPTVNIFTNQDFFTVTSQLDPKTSQRFKVVCNEMLEFDGTTHFVTWKKYIPLDGLVVSYNNNLAEPASINQNAIYVFFFSCPDTDDPVGNNAILSSMPIIGFTGKLRFFE